MNLTWSMITPPSSLVDVAVFSLGALSCFLGVLQPAVAGYALRLTRNLGTHRVGWWVFAAFSLLAFGHLVQPSPMIPGQSSLLNSINIADVLVPLLLLIGMAHTESVFVQRVRLERRQRAVLAELESRALERRAAIEKERDALLDELARTQQEQKLVQDSERDFRLLFASIPQVLWVFDLRSLRFLAVNRSAVARCGFTSEEFLARRVCDLLPGEDVPAFLQDAALPAFGAEPRGVWHVCTKEGTVLDLEVIAADLRFGGCPARLILASDITPRQ